MEVCKIVSKLNSDGSKCRDFKVGSIVQHFKGGLYRIIAFPRHSETGEAMVVYESLIDGNVWVRPYGMFVSPVDKIKYPNVSQEYRLEIVDIVMV